MQRAFFRLIILLLLWPVGHSPAAAAIEIAFYSREMSRSHYPHAFVRLSGTDERTGEVVDATYGFTARSVTPAILLGSVSGRVVTEEPRLIARSRRHFAFPLNNERFDEVLATVERWRRRAQPSYNLNRRNCVHFVADLARASGLRVERTEGLMKRPRLFLEHIQQLNSPLVGELATSR